jgi:multidrug efflux pump subunit AcrB
MTVPECFPPEDRLALFVVSIAMAANDVEYAIRQAEAASPIGATDEDRHRNRFTYKVRIANGFLYEGIATLRHWEQNEPEVVKLLQTLPDPDSRECLKVVRGLEQRVGSKTLEQVRQNTFHYPRPDPSKSPDSTTELAEVIAKLSDVAAALDVSPDVDHTFRFADTIATTLALRRLNDHAQVKNIRIAAVAFVKLAWGIHMVYCDKRKIPFESIS